MLPTRIIAAVAFCAGLGPPAPGQPALPPPGAALVDLTVTTGSAGGLRVGFTHDQAPIQIELLPYALRSVDFAVDCVAADGTTTRRDLPITTYRGSVATGPAGHVAASLIDGAIRALVFFDDPRRGVWALEPTTDDPAGPYRFTPSERFPTALAACGVVDATPAPPMLPTPPTGDAGRSQPCGVNPLCEIAFDADYEFFTLNNSSTATTVADIEMILNGVAEIYEREMGLTFTITRIIVRETPADPYTAAGHVALLNEMITEWTTNQIAVKRDIAHLMTGRDLIGTTIGYALIGTVCDLGNGLGLSQSRFTSNLTQRVVLTAHEIGHNFGAIHCDGDADCHIMCATLNGCAGLGNPPIFGSRSTGLIDNQTRNSENCLDRVQLCPGDASCDGAVNFDDFSVLSSCWGAACGDLNGDATTDFTDFAIIASDWNCGYPWGFW